MRRRDDTKRAARPAEAVILFWVGPHRLAIAAGALREIRNNRGLAPEEFGCTSVVSAAEIFGVRADGEARLLVLRRGQIAVRVDRVDRLVDITEMRRLPRMFRGRERVWYRGLTVIGDVVTPIVNPEAFVQQARPAPSGAEAAALTAAANTTQEGVPA